MTLEEFTIIKVDVSADTLCYESVQDSKTMIYCCEYKKL